jgi:hypothetical protein
MEISFVFVFYIFLKFVPILSDDELEKKYSEFKIFPDVIDEVPKQLMIGESIAAKQFSTKMSLNESYSRPNKTELSLF